jgi:hypothetical protein
LFCLLFLGLFVEIQAQASRLRETLALFETGATQPGRCASDAMRGGAGEISRYQILPSVWRQYTKSRDYTNPEVAWRVADRIVQDRTRWFQERTGRLPDPVELYLLWNKPGHFHQAGFKVTRVRSVFRHRAQRFANLWSVATAPAEIRLAQAR